MPTLINEKHALLFLGFNTRMILNSFIYFHIQLTFRSKSIMIQDKYNYTKPKLL